MQGVPMLRHILLVVVIAPHVSGDDIRKADLAADPVVREMSWQLLSETRFGFSHEEVAAFVVRTADGYRCVAWPSDGLVDSARWEGRFPDGVLAIIHTHPNWMPSPSTIDAHLARASRIPVYVITRSRISKTMGESSEVVVSGDWKPAATRRVCSPFAPAIASTAHHRKPAPAYFH
jgi:proteasome lid subunit RPN8/RPN11